MEHALTGHHICWKPPPAHLIGAFNLVVALNVSSGGNIVKASHSYICICESLHSTYIVCRHNKLPLIRSPFVFYVFFFSPLVAVPLLSPDIAAVVVVGSLILLIFLLMKKKAHLNTTIFLI